MYKALLPLAVMLLYLVVCPYTKVEESFNMQATHDILAGLPISKFDHLEFPGVVPRTFLGPLWLAALTWWIPVKGERLQFCARAALGMLNISSLVFMAPKGRQGTIFLVLTSLQFHYLFYASRTLPNEFALVLVQYAYGFWFRGQHRMLIAFLAFAAAVFRSELVLLALPIVLMLIVERKVHVWDILVVGTIASAIAICGTVAIDSYYWNKLVWPELEVFLFNTWQNKSSEWGTLPFHAYWTSLLPRSLPLSYPLGIYGLVRHRAKILYPAIVFVFLYSFLPHKEWRFIVYAIPLFHLAAAQCIHQQWRFLRAIFLLGCAGCVVLSGLMLTLAARNYPGGYALALTHTLPANATVHLDVFTCQTGVTRFGQDEGLAAYSKQEDVMDYSVFSHLLTSEPDTHPEFRIVNVVQCFTHFERTRPFVIGWDPWRWKFGLSLPVAPVYDDCIWLMQRADASSV